MELLALTPKTTIDPALLGAVMMPVHNQDGQAYSDVLPGKTLFTVLQKIKQQLCVADMLFHPDGRVSNPCIR
ncbi:MAG: hypothetical protein Ct9H300mP28_08350 [Pseudomonadota bacterium]|nr:MAG: hypothetical protein Ct9H300mP28_08350 [Pseudomonadota bacterium]